MARKKEPRAARATERDAPLFTLPPEMRNTIYELIVSQETCVAYRSAQLLYAPSLSLVSRQLRNEYESVYRHFAPQHAKTVRVHTRDFKGKDLALPLFTHPRTSPVERTYILHIHLTNHWTGVDCQSFLASNQFLDLRPPCEIEVSFDPRSFDLEYLRRALGKCKWNAGMVERAFEEACRRYGLRFEEVMDTRRVPKYWRTR